MKIKSLNALLSVLLITGLAAPPSAADPSREASMEAYMEAHMEDSADLILNHGRFYPVSSAEPVEGSLAVRDGRIVYLGPAGGAEAFHGPDTQVVDLGGRAVTPGLIDAHSHLMSLGAALEQVDLVGTGSYDQVIERIAEAASRVPAGTWIRGRGWDQNDWAEKSFPRHQRLTAAVPDHPVWVTRIDGHAALLNARALEALEITTATADPSGGRFLRDDAGAPTGVLVDNAMDVVGERLPAASRADRVRRLEAATRHVLALGLTTTTDMGVSQGDVDAYREVWDRGDLDVRSVLFLTDDDELLSAWFRRGPERTGDRRLSVTGVKLYADGALGSRGAALVEPYSDDPDNLGLLVSSGDHMAEVCADALEAGFQVGIHAIGDRGGLVALDAVERAFGGEPRPAARFRIEHAQVMRPADIGRMARLGVIASMQPTHATSDMPWAGDRVGERRLEGAYAWRKMERAGVRLALGSDFPVESADPRLGLHAAVTRQDLDGSPAGGWLPGERLDRHEALKGFTLDAAYALFLEDEVGSLEVGKRADLVVFGEDPMTVPAERLTRVPVDLTLVDGEVVYRRGDAP
jgi:predicted amidohydrolase YtcJ